MRATQKFVLFSVIIALSFGTIAQVPDDLDREKYYQIYQSELQYNEQVRAQAYADEQTARQIQDDLNRIQSELRHAIDQARDARREHHELNQRLGDRRRDIQNLRQENENFQRRVDGQRQNISRLEGEVRQKQGDVSRAENEYQNGPGKHLAEIDARLANAKRNRDQAQGKVNQFQTQKTNLAGRISNLTQQKASKEKEVQFLEASIPVLKSKIPKHEASIRDNEQKARSYENRAGSHKKRIDELSAKKADLQRRLNNTKNEQQKKNLQDQINQVNGQIENSYRTYLSDMAVAKQAREAAERSRNELNKDRQTLSQVESTLPRTRSELSQISSQLSQAQGQMGGIDANLNQARSELNRANAQVANIETNRRQVEQNANSKSTEIARLKTEADRAAKNLEASRSQIRRDEQAINENHRRIQDLREKLEWSERRINELDRHILELDRRVGYLEGHVHGLESQAQQAWDRYRISSDELAQSERRLAAARAQYEQVNRRYEQRLSQAQSSGASEGASEGSSEGAILGKQDGAADANTMGQDLGSQEGLLAGFLQGLLSGQKEGKAQGYEHGLKAPQNYDAGVAAGLAQGEKDAWALAIAQEYPRGRAEMRKSLLSQVPTQKIEVDNKTGQTTTSAELVPQMGFAPQFMSSTALSEDEASTQSVLDLKIEETKAELARVQAQAKQFATQNPVVNSGADANNANCNFGYHEFDEVCRAAYVDSYDNAFKVQYTKTYMGAVKSTFSSVYKKASDTAKPTRVQEGFDFAKPLAYAQWDSIGAAEAHKKGYEVGKKQGYDANIKQAKSQEFARGQQEEALLFETAAVNHLLGLKVVPGAAAKRLVAGGEWQLTLDVANFSKKVASQSGEWTVKVESQNEIGILDAAEAGLVGIPVSTRALVKNVVTGKIAAKVRSTSMIQLKVTLVAPDGMTQEVTIKERVHKK